MHFIKTYCKEMAQKLSPIEEIKFHFSKYLRHELITALLAYP